MGVNSIQKPTDHGTSEVLALNTQSKHSRPHWGPCFHCGGRHSSLSCRCKSWICNACGKKGHVACICCSRSASKSTNKQKRQEHCKSPGDWSSPEQVHTLFYVKDRQHLPLLIMVYLNEAKLRMEVDTVQLYLRSVIPHTNVSGLELPDLNPQSNHQVCCCAHTVYWRAVVIVGQVVMDVSYGGKHHTLPLLIVHREGPLLLGRGLVFNFGAEARRTFCAVH